MIIISTNRSVLITIYGKKIGSRYILTLLVVSSLTSKNQDHFEDHEIALENMNLKSPSRLAMEELEDPLSLKNLPVFDAYGGGAWFSSFSI